MIEIARSAGFCRGVARAVKLCEQAVGEGKRVVTLGPVIHNSDEVARLCRMGVRVGTIDDIREGETAVICSHGATREIEEQLKSRGIPYIDATCPDVARISEIVSSEPHSIVCLFGDRHHTEVRAIASRCKSVEIFANSDEFMAWLEENGSDKPLVMAAQTTFLIDEWEKCVQIAKQVCTNAKTFDTICRATSVRQGEAASMASRLPAILVVGGKNSANTRRLYELCSSVCENTVWVENAGAVPSVAFQDIGIIAGASTPRWIIEEVASMLERNENMESVVAETADDNMEAVVAEAASENTEAVVAEAASENTEESSQPAEAVEPVILSEATAPVAAEAAEAPDAAAAASSSGDSSFAELLEQSLKTLTSGDKVTGVVTGVGSTEVQVDLGAKHAGFLALEELTDDPTKSADELVKIGDEIEVFIVRVNDADGIATLSRRRLDAIKGWEDVQAACDEKTTVEGYVTEENKGGIVVSVKGVRVFVPASHTGIPRDGDMSSLLKTKVQLKITEVNQARKRVVGSIRAVDSDRRREAQGKIWESIAVGDKFEGKVRSLLSYGAFIDIGGVDGMVHVSEMSWKRVHQPSDILSAGDTVTVSVIALDPDKRKISLSMRDPADNPWTKFVEKVQIGDVIDVKVVKLMAFGAFAEIVPGVDGLIHISQIADHRIAKPGDVLSEGQTVTVKVTNIDFERQKVWLSIRALIEPEEQPEEQAAEGETEYVADTVIASSEDGKLEISETYENAESAE